MGDARCDLAKIGHVGQKEGRKGGANGPEKAETNRNAAKTRKRVNLAPESKKFIIIV
jgi:hypothetical protein